MNLRSLLRFAVTFAALVLGGVPAGAAPPVVQISQAPITSHYDEAARELGFPEWGEITRSDAAVHLTIRLGLRDFRMGFCIPPSVPPKQAEIWLQELSDAMGWTDVELTSSRQPYGTLLTATVHKPTRPAGLGQQQVRIDLPRLRTELARLTPLPLQIAVRTPAQELVPSIPAAAQGTWKKMRYVFFRDPGPTARPLTLTHGMGRRWQVAIICAWLAWMLFPSLVFYAVRELQLQDGSRTPKERWDTYRRWLKPVWLTTIVGMVLTPWLLSLEGVAYLLGPLGPMVGSLMWPALAMVSTWVVTPQSLIGFPLAREVSERQREQRFSDLLRKQLAFFVLVNALVPLMFLIPAWIDALPWANSTDRPPAWGRSAMSLVFLSVPLIVLGVWLSGERRWRLRAKGVPPGEVEANPELVEQVRDLTAHLATPVKRVLLVPRGDMERLRGAVVHGEIATVLEDLTEKLDFEQLAGLIAAERLGSARDGKSQVPGAVGITLACFGFGSLAWMMISTYGSTIAPSSAQLLLAFFCLPLSAVALFVDQRQRRQRQERADLQVVDALTDRSVFLNALRALEFLRMEAGNMDPELIPVPPLFTERRRRLVRKLGLE